MSTRRQAQKYPKILFGIYLLIWGLLAIAPLSRDDWFLENILVVVGLPILIYLYKKSLLSKVSYTLIFIFLVLHTIGSHYTYSEVPFGKLISSWLGFERNHFDRAVHFLWGFLLTIPVFELLRRNVARNERTAFIFAFCLVVTFGVLYEFMEWAAAMVVNPEAGTAFLGTQGDEWDAQKDMALNTLGSACAVVFFPWVKRLKKTHKS